MNPRLENLAQRTYKAEARPSEPQYLRIEQLTEETAQAETAFQQLLDTRIQPINEMMQAMPQKDTCGNKSF